MGSLAGTAHASNENANLSRWAAQEQKSHVDQKGNMLRDRFFQSDIKLWHQGLLVVSAVGVFSAQRTETFTRTKNLPDEVRSVKPPISFSIFQGFWTHRIVGANLQQLVLGFHLLWACSCGQRGACFHSLYSNWKSLSWTCPPFDPHEISVLVELASRTPALSKLTRVPLQPKAPHDYVCRTNQSIVRTSLKSRTCRNAGFSVNQND